MFIEFKTNDWRYDGYEKFPHGTSIGPLIIFTEDLPVGSLSEHLEPKLIRPAIKYGIKVYCRSWEQVLELETLGNPSKMCQIDHQSYEQKGLKVQLAFKDGYVDGALFPIPVPPNGMSRSRSFRLTDMRSKQ